MQSWQQFREVKENLISENMQGVSFARMAADAAIRAAGSPENPNYFVYQCNKAIEYLQKAMQSQREVS